MLSGVVPCFEPSRLVPKALEAIAVSRSGYGPPAFAHSVTLVSQDELVLADATMVPLLEKIVPNVPSIRAVVLLTDKWVHRMPGVLAYGLLWPLSVPWC